MRHLLLIFVFFIPNVLLAFDYDIMLMGGVYSDSAVGGSLAGGVAVGEFKSNIYDGLFIEAEACEKGKKAHIGYTKISREVLFSRIGMSYLTLTKDTYGFKKGTEFTGVEIGIGFTLFKILLSSYKTSEKNDEKDSITSFKIGIAY